jgi:hypothetical protein
MYEEFQRDVLDCRANIESVDRGRADSRVNCKKNFTELEEIQISE